MGSALRALMIPVGEVLTSPTYRALETVRFAQWAAKSKSYAELGDNGQGMQQVVPEAQAAWLQRQVTQAPASTATAEPVNTLSRLYPSDQVQLYPQRSATQAADMPELTRFADLDDVWVSANSSFEIHVAIRQMTRLLRERHHLRDGCRTTSGSATDRDLRGARLTSHADNLLCASPSSLVVGGAGIMNIMLIAVTERTREIGIRMAVGARARDILRQFLVEAVLLCMVGGVVGILLGRGVSGGDVGAAPLADVALCLRDRRRRRGVATVGIVFGLSGRQGRRLDPIEALRYE
jgi:hypothetical protein